ncbi:type II toxin-antitoxin system RelE/ParE family toxin [Mucilaginibacter flavus]|uniref:type II toxin-antitoxin system RelE/ParE family toxin n=1 Tax=Mucilaginibacter flavus TaxID=931504 RepID=UPI0025B4E79D|nr:type II toxin-antitoxin system RelE/ParE family toxin [Mucilaginibacter flavus]MDN3582664.1 type II toxin-antitoxin system RelE/ParE family toxin [Mucilaginibacter flavus]
MAYSLHYLDIVKVDLVEAKDWYKNQKPGLEKQFSREVKACIARLQKNPLGYEIKYKNVRTAFTDVFPYAIHFFVNQSINQIVIIAVVHQTRNPLLADKRSDDE